MVDLALKKKKYGMNFSSEFYYHASKVYFKIKSVVPSENLKKLIESLLGV